MNDRRLTSGRVFNAEVDAYKKRFRELVDEFKDSLMTAGYPPGQVPVEPHEQYRRLKRAELAGEPWFNADPEAQRALAALERRYSGIKVVT